MLKKYSIHIQLKYQVHNPFKFFKKKLSSISNDFKLSDKIYNFPHMLHEYFFALVGNVPFKCVQVEGEENYTL